jgi:S1-C subfamily serine protease
LVNEADGPAPPRGGRNLLLIAAVLAAAIVGGFVARSFSFSPVPSTGARRPILQLTRGQRTLPSLAATIGLLCPSVATIVPHANGTRKSAGQPVTPTPPHAAAILISADGWILTSGQLPSGGQLDALFGDGTRVPISDIRSDPVSGLTVARIPAQGDTDPLALGDQSFPQVGDFAFALQSPNGTGCSAASSMLSSDFLVDGGGDAISLRLQQDVGPMAPGTPVFSTDGRIIGIATGGIADTLIPAPIAATIVDELIRNSPTPLLAYGFRAIDLSPNLATRLGDLRARGVAVAIVEPRSSVDRAGLRAGDIVAAVNSSPVSSASELSRALDAATGSSTLTIVRGSNQLSMTVSRSLAASPQALAP